MNFNASQTMRGIKNLSFGFGLKASKKIKSFKIKEKMNNNPLFCLDEDGSGEEDDDEEETENEQEIVQLNNGNATLRKTGKVAFGL